MQFKKLYALNTYLAGYIIGLIFQDLNLKFNEILFTAIYPAE